VRSRLAILLVASLLGLSACPVEPEEVPTPAEVVDADDGATPEAVDYNLAPTVMVTAPAPGTIIGLSDTIKLVGQVQDDRDPLPELDCRWLSSLDGDLGVTVPLDSGLTQLVVGGLSAGQHLLTLSATDSEGLRGSAQGIVIVNGPPSAPVVVVSPAEPGPGDDLVASIVTPPTDPNRGEENLILDWRWVRDGVTAATMGSDTVPSDQTLPGETWEVRVRAFDGTVFGPEGSDAVTVGESEPAAER
jgi:hypothetical protein